jgi:hypothetical protein
MKTTTRLLATLTLLASPALAQTNTFPASGNVGIGVLAPTEMLQVQTGNIAQIASGALGDPWAQWMHMGTRTYPSYPLYLGSNKYGLGIVYESDGVFFGMSRESYNRVDGVIAWGDDGDDCLRFLFNGADVARFTSDGKFGIGEVNPAAKLHVKQSGDFSAIMESTGANSYLSLKNASGGSSISSSGNTLYVGESGPIFLRSGGWDVKLAIQPDGNVGIGTTNPQHKLAVNGTIKAKEIIVETVGWSDYVFASDYRLAPLSEVEAHIAEKKHLPGIPSAAEVAEKGVNVAQVQAALLAKVEELTLHLIAQEKALLALKAENAELKTEIQTIKQR